MATAASERTSARLNLLTPRQKLEKLYHLLLEALLVRLAEQKPKAQYLDIARKVLADNGISLTTLEDKDRAATSLQAILDEMPEPPDGL